MFSDFFNDPKTFSPENLDQSTTITGCLQLLLKNGARFGFYHYSDACGKKLVKERLFQEIYDTNAVDRFLLIQFGNELCAVITVTNKQSIQAIEQKLSLTKPILPPIFANKPWEIYFKTNEDIIRVLKFLNGIKQIPPTVLAEINQLLSQNKAWRTEWEKEKKYFPTQWAITKQLLIAKQSKSNVWSRMPTEIIREIRKHM